MQVENAFDSITMVDAVAKPQKVINAFRDLLKGRKVIIYGAALIGEVLYHCLSELEVNIAYIVDRDAERIGNLSGFRVETPAILASIARDAEEYLIVFATSVRTASAVSEDLSKLGLSFNVIFNGQKVADCLRAASCALNHQKNEDVSHAYCGDCSILDSTCPVLRQRAKDESGVIINTGGSKRTVTIGYALGNICSLNCKFCFESVPLYTTDKKYFVETDSVIKDIQRVAQASEYITFVEFIGGEPFLHKGLPEIVKFCLRVSNIAYVHVFTNGTIRPSNALLEALKNERASVYISNYTGFLTLEQEKKVQETKRILKDNGILHMHGGEKKWFDMSNYDYHDESIEALEKRYADCQTHNCNRLHNGVLYVCPHHFAGVNLGKFQESNTIHIHELDDVALVDALDQFKEMKSADACKYCDMPDAPLIRSGD